MGLPKGWTDKEEQDFQAWSSDHDVKPDENNALFDYREHWRKSKLTGAEKPETTVPVRDEITNRVGNAMGISPDARKVIINAMRNKYLPLKNFDENSSVGIGTNSPIGIYYKRRF